MFGKLEMLLVIKCRIPWAQGIQIGNECYRKFLLKLKSIRLPGGFLVNAFELLSICKHHKGRMERNSLRESQNLTQNF